MKNVLQNDNIKANLQFKLYMLQDKTSPCHVDVAQSSLVCIGEAPNWN